MFRVTYENEKRQQNLKEEKWCTRAQFRLLTPTMYRSRMANTRQTLSMDCSARDTSGTPTWENTKNADMKKMYLQTGKNEDSLELELGASASRVHYNLQSDGTVINQRKSSVVSNNSLQLDLHVEGSAPITLLVRDESRSTKSYQPRDSPTSPLSPFLTRKVRSASPHVENEKDTLATPCGGTCCPRGTVKQVSWGSTSSLTPSPQPATTTPALSPWSNEADWWPTTPKLSLTVPTQGILRLPSPISSTDDPKLDQVNEASECDECDEDMNQSNATAEIDSDPKVCLPNMVMLTDSQNVTKESDESLIRKGNFSKRKLSYNARSDTVLEMCDREDISFIDEDPSDIIVDDNHDTNYDVNDEDNHDDDDDDDNYNMQQIVIKINNEIELTSIIVNTHNQSRGKRPSQDLPKYQSFQDHKEQKEFVSSHQQNEGDNHQTNKISSLQDSSLNFPSPCVLTEQRYHSPGIESNGTSKTRDNQTSIHKGVRSSRFLSSRRQAHSLLSRRNVLVRQQKLDTDFHPDLTRKRHSFVPDSQPRHHQSRRIRKTASL